MGECFVLSLLIAFCTLLSLDFIDTALAAVLCTSEGDFKNMTACPVVFFQQEVIADTWKESIT